MYLNKFKLYYWSIIFIPFLLMFLSSFNLIGDKANYSFNEYTQLSVILIILWIPGLVYSLISLAGLILEGEPSAQERDSINKLQKYGWPKDSLLIVSFVSSGINSKALRASIERALTLLQKNNINFEIEAILEEHSDFYINDKKIHIIKVPKAYSTRNDSKYKSRALNFALEIRRKRNLNLDRSWVLHMDEESHLTESALAGIADFISDPLNRDRIAQGEIKYNQFGYGRDLLITVTDSLRTGEDLGSLRFVLKYLKLPLVGIHGSFLLIPAEIEDRIGFDFGPRGSIAEDNYFAFTAAQNGIRFGWLSGYIQEQSPFTLIELIKQRRRWIIGISKLAFDTRISFAYRIFLLFKIVSSRINLIIFFVLPLIILFQGQELVNNGWKMRWGLVASTCSMLYLIGTYRNLISTSLTFFQRIQLLFGTILLFPVSLVVENLALIYALLTRDTGFYVVNKDYTKIDTGIESFSPNLNDSHSLLPKVSLKMEESDSLTQ